jgi:cytochrome P450
VVHPRDVEQVLSSRSETYVKGPTYDPLRAFVGNGLLTLEGASWKKRRQLEQPYFYPKSLASLAATMARRTGEVLDRLRAALPEGGVVDAHQEMVRLTLGIAVETLFGWSPRLPEDTSSAALNEALLFVSNRNDQPLQLPLWLPTPGHLRLRRALRVIDELVHDLIRIGRSCSDEEERPTLLRMLLQVRDPESGRSLTDREIRDEFVTYLLAAHETTALALTWGFTLFADQQPVLERMREEVQRVVGERAPGAEDVSELSYMRMVIDEILRLRPPAWMVGRDVLAEDELGGFAVPAGCRVLLPAYLTHRHPDFWPHPEHFDPERFSPASKERRERGSYYPFSSGPRICIGFTFALMEMSIVLAMLLQRCQLRLEGKEPVAPEGHLTLRPATPVKLRIDWRD